MSVKERKLREKEKLKLRIIENAHEILRNEGLDGLTMRTLAQKIEYSQSKLYEFFNSKQQLCAVLYEELCAKLLTALQAVPGNMDAEAYLRSLITETVAFHSAHPYADTLFTRACFGPDKVCAPQAFVAVESLFLNGLRRINSPYLQTDAELERALEVIRCILIGVSTLMNTNNSTVGSARALAITDTIINILIRGLKA